MTATYNVWGVEISVVLAAVTILLVMASFLGCFVGKQTLSSGLKKFYEDFYSTTLWGYIPQMTSGVEKFGSFILVRNFLIDITADLELLLFSSDVRSKTLFLQRVPLVACMSYAMFSLALSQGARLCNDNSCYILEIQAVHSLLISFSFVSFYLFYLCSAEDRVVRISCFMLAFMALNVFLGTVELYFIWLCFSVSLFVLFRLAVSLRHGED